MPPARAVIVQDGKVAMIERRRDGRRYFVVPGGGLEPGETARAAAARETWEELGLRVEVGALVAEARFGGDVQHFFLAMVVGGAFGTGRGPEMTGGAGPAAGTYRPVWVAIDDLPRLPVPPASIAGVIGALAGRAAVRDIVELGDEWSALARSLAPSGEDGALDPAGSPKDHRTMPCHRLGGRARARGGAAYSPSTCS